MPSVSLPEIAKLAEHVLEEVIFLLDGSWDVSEDWLQSVILFLVSAVVGITGFLLSVIAYSTSLGASLAWCAFAICIFGLSHLDWECRLDLDVSDSVDLHADAARITH